MQDESPVLSFLVWLEGEVPSVHATLAPPATAKSLKMLRRKWSEPPDDFLELYRAHDGQVGEDVDFLPSYCLMPIADIVRLRGQFEELDEELDEDEENAWDDAWIPFAQLPVYNQYLCLHAKTGEVVAYDHRGQDWAVIARGFGEFLTHIRIAVKQRQFVVTKDGIAEHKKHARWMTAWVRACEPSKPRKPRKRNKKPKRRRPRSR
ncbi:MAG TPA: SMI1/KNR4 family protein [Kofleriaceae bacterium]